jgi:hypothetical protein
MAPTTQHETVQPSPPIATTDPALITLAAALRAAGASFENIRRALGGELGFTELGLPLVRVGDQLLTMSERNVCRLKRLLTNAQIPFLP